ncbi:restriction endonuclease subunit S [Pannonibacter phragmitetus]|uniref:restriction endonuclease subunit S n=1 Tax=Pannonibacter phragmitetus TaxID=121719 RepID=UPI00067C5FF8|nr:restriction endonuclease subunit S [Pannonibacter phragmitetus]
MDGNYHRAFKKFEHLGLAGTQPLGTLLKAFFSGGTPSKSHTEYWNGDIPWASPKDFGPFVLTETEDLITAEAVANSAAKIVPKGSVLVVVRSGVLAHTLPVAITGRDLAINQDLKALVCKDGIMPEFLATYLLTFGSQILPLVTKHGVTVQSVNTPEFRALPVPILDSAAQQRLASRYSTAIEAKKKKLAEADALLASIDDYLLAELGITVPPEPENTIKERMFRTKASDLGGWRFDARVHQYDFNLHSATYPNAKLGTICAINPKTVFRGLTDTDDVSFVPMDAISDRLGIIEKPDTRVLAENVGYTSFREGDLLWAKITPCMENGKSAVAEGLHREFGYGSTEYHVLRSPDGSLDMGYLHALLRMKRVRKAAVRFFTGASGHQRVDADFLRTLELPVPSLEVQKALAAEARARVARAVQLEEEANAELARAKADIEAILLGDVA